MFEKKTEKEARQEILKYVDLYYRKYHNNLERSSEIHRIPYAARVYGSEEMTNLVDSALEFWLTAGRYTQMFEKGLADQRLGGTLYDLLLGLRGCLLLWRKT